MLLHLLLLFTAATLSFASKEGASSKSGVSSKEEVDVTCGDPLHVYFPTSDFVCTQGCTCLVNVTTVLPNIQLKAEENASMIVNFDSVGSGARWTIQSSGTVTVYCNMAGSCTNLRLLGENVNAHCMGATSCGGVDCEWASAKIVQCYGYFTCEDDDASCDAPLFMRRMKKEELTK